MKIVSGCSAVRQFSKFLDNNVRHSGCGSVVYSVLMSFFLFFTDYSGCNLGAQEIACISIQTAESIAQLICEQQCGTQSCKDLCKSISDIAVDKSCNTPKQFMCNLDNCPQNWQSPSCKGVAVAGGR